MKIRVEYTVDIDAETWASEYGLDKSEVRDDVKKYAETVALAQFGANGLLADDSDNRRHA